MIKVEQIYIEEFRGVRTLTLDFGGLNYAISGPNGTGKSGIVDALEFALSGNISRLSGEGRGDLSVKAHGPHVDSKDTPEKARVVVKLSIPSLGKTATVERNVKSPKTPIITPDEPDIRAVLDEVAKHPEIVLSRREIIKYVLAEPGKRSKEVQALLQLDDLEGLRMTFQKIANGKERDLKPLETQRIQTRSELMLAMSISAATGEAIIEAANTRRATLGLPALTKLEANTSIADGLESQASAVSPIPKVEAVADLQSAREAIEHLAASDFEAKNGSAKQAVADLAGDETKIASVERRGMLQTALALFDGSVCPVCETDWDPEDFRAKVQALLEHLAEVEGERQKTVELIEPTTQAYEGLLNALRQAARYAPKVVPPIDIAPLAACAEALKLRIDRLNKFLPLSDTASALEIPAAEVLAAQVAINAIAAAVHALPEPTERDAARDYLIRADERLNAYRNAASRHAAVEKEAKLARAVFEVYAIEINAELDAIYKQVESEFQAFYRSINADDEGNFEAHLAPSIGKLGFAVNFYGRGFFPPGAYHSEGHQDGMGLCLYLALMKHLLGDGFTFAVLDDVLMSVDAGHRREVCTLLKNEFPNTQFVLTTHDGIWLRHMRSVGLIPPKAGMEFRKWSVELGPAEWKPSYIWAEIDDEVSKNEVGKAAGLLRRHLEYLSAEICSELEAQVVFKGDGRFELGELLPAAVSALKKHLKAAKAAAVSWGKTDAVAAITTSEEELAAAFAATQAEQWAINSSIHYNAWDTMLKQDFEPVVAAFKRLEKAFECSTCGGRVYLIKKDHKAEMVRCRCSERSYSLVRK